MFIILFYTLFTFFLFTVKITYWRLLFTVIAFHLIHILNYLYLHNNNFPGKQKLLNSYLETRLHDIRESK